MQTKTTRPLPAGTTIDFCGEQAAVVNDDGGSMITVKVDGVVQRWAWKSEGVECTVVEPNTEENNA